MKYTYASINIYCSYPLPMILETSPSHMKTRKLLNNKEKSNTESLKVKYIGMHDSFKKQANKSRRANQHNQVHVLGISLCTYVTF